MPSQKKPVSKPAKRIRILVAKPGLDGHDRGALILTRAFRDAGMEVIYTGFLATPEQVAQMAIDEDVDVVAMSLLNGAHMTAFPKVAKLIREKGGGDILLVGGGIIPDEDKPLLEKQGITGNFASAGDTPGSWDLRLKGCPRDWNQCPGRGLEPRRRI